MTAADIEARLRAEGNLQLAQGLSRFFKTGPGEYGEGDQFIGLKVPAVRQLVREYRQLPVDEVKRLLASPIHEARLLALLLLVQSFQKGDTRTCQSIYRLYLKNTCFINNWDLVDASAEHIVGGYLFDRTDAPLRRLAKSKVLWERRIAVVATFHFIRRNRFDTTLTLCEILLADPHDLIHKATGWMLREVGKRDQDCLEGFLRQHCRIMPRTMLRYAIERFPQAKRLRYLKGTI
jgi:3-methyladenine DNA glycosylase AlkD